MSAQEAKANKTERDEVLSQDLAGATCKGKAGQDKCATAKELRPAREAGTYPVARHATKIIH